MNGMETTPRPAVIDRDLRWWVSDGEYVNEMYASASWAAAWLVDEAMRQHLKDAEPRVTAHLQDRVLGVLWDATADVAAVMKATGWPTRAGDTLRLRSTTITLVRDILVADDTMMDAPPPGTTDPHTYALVCR